MLKIFTIIIHISCLQKETHFFYAEYQEVEFVVFIIIIKKRLVKKVKTVLLKSSFHVQMRVYKIYIEIHFYHKLDLGIY